jgi:undecaprenyl-diphosphatase
MSAALAAPLGGSAALVAAATGAAQEQPVAGVALGLVAVSVLAQARRRDERVRLPRLAAGVAAGFATRLVWAVAPGTPATVARHRTWTGLDPSPDGAGVGLVVNAHAGTEDAPAGDLRAALPEAEIVVLDDPERLGDELERLARSSDVRAIGVAGGDGSINTAAGVALAHGLPLVVIPAGTLNHLARDLGVESLADAVEAVNCGSAIEIDVARIAGRPFLNTASFGSYVEIVDAREDLEERIGKWPALAVAITRVLRRGRPVEVEIDGRPQRLWAIFVGNCRYRPDGMAPTWRERLDDGQLDVRVADASHPFSRARLVLAVLTGRLHHSPVFRSWPATALAVHALDGPLRLARDGETFPGGDRFDIAKTGERLAIYTPQSRSG